MTLLATCTNGVQTFEFASAGQEKPARAASYAAKRERSRGHNTSSQHVIAHRQKETISLIKKAQNLIDVLTSHTKV